MRKIILTLAARRELTAVKVAARNRYARYAAELDNTLPLLAPVPYLGRHGQSTLPRHRKAPKVATPKAHRTSVTAVGDKFLAVCTCGEKIQKNATGERYAKGMATKHVNATSVVTV